MANNDKGKVAGATICVRCKYHVADGDGNHGWDGCKAGTVTNFVTGEPFHSMCRVKNDKGQCPDYKERES